MHHGQTRKGKEKHHKVAKKHVNFKKTGGNVLNVGEKIIFAKWGKCIEIVKIGGNSKFLVDDLKKIWENLPRSLSNFSETGGSETEGGLNASLPHGGWTPLHIDVKNFDPKNKNKIKTLKTFNKQVANRGSLGKLAGKSLFLQIIGNDNANISVFSLQHTY